VTADQEATRRLGILAQLILFSRLDFGRAAVISALSALLQYKRTFAMLVEW
jgi:hypothetical protein